jgi:hypothetical protein
MTTTQCDLLLERQNYLGDGFGGFVDASTAYVRRVAGAVAVEKIQFT